MNALPPGAPAPPPSEGARTPAASLHPTRRPFRKALATARKRVLRKIPRLEEEAAAAEAAEAWREAGELLKAHLDAVPRGAESVTLPDLFHPGTERTVPLDPRLGPMANARRHFKTYRKLVKSAEHVARELETARALAEELGDLATRLAEWEAEAPPAVPPPEALVAAAAAHRIHVEGLQPPREEGPRRDAPPEGTRRFISKEGVPLLVGKAARDNDRLSFRIARGNDWWFHAAGCPGSHVVACYRPGRQGEPALPQETLLDAAHLAIHFSKARGASRMEVTYTQAKNLRKGKRAPAGQVTVVNEKTLALRMEPKRLKRLLESGG